MPDTTTTHTDCIERGTTPCHGTAQPRMSLSGSGMPFSRCDRHSERSPRPRGGDPATLPPAPAGRLRPHLRRRTMGRGLTTRPTGAATHTASDRPRRMRSVAAKRNANTKKCDTAQCVESLSNKFAHDWPNSRR